MLSESLLQKITQIRQQCVAQELKIAVAESCTGGLLATTLTEIAGASEFFDRGFVSYSNQSKQDMLSVSLETLAKYGAVSAEVAKEMVQGVFQHSLADVALAITGIAGPGGGSAKKPVGLVFIGCGRKNQAVHIVQQIFYGTRYQIRHSAMEEALSLIEKVSQPRKAHSLPR